MRRPWARLLVIAAVTVSALVIAVGGSPATTRAPTLSSASPSPAPEGPGHAPLTVPSSTSNPGLSMARSALAAVAARGLNPRVVSVPRPSATPGEIAQAEAQGYVRPLYTGTPAPIGIADYGLSAGPGGTLVATVLNTTGLRGEIVTGGAGIHGLDLADSSPDGFGMQMNSVLTNVTLFGQSGYSFWTQAIALYYPAAQELYLDSNIWNWSGGPLTTNALFDHGPDGIQVDESFYYAMVGPFPVSGPFQLTFYLNSTLVGGRDAVYFGADISSAAGSIDFPYWDYAIFNSLASGGVPLTRPSNFTADGFHYNPAGLTDDFELILGGPNGGSQADLITADAEMGLEFRSGSQYVTVPSASSFGGETGETVTGAYVGWSQGPGGPGGLSPYGVVSTGPAILSGLWHAGRSPGVVPVELELHPSNAFVFLNASPDPFTISEPEYVPTIATSTLYLSPGTYRYTVELSDYVSRSGTLVVPLSAGHDVPLGIYLALPRDLSLGIYTPLFAWENSQLPAISYLGQGTAWSPYVVFNNQPAPLGPLFGVVNDYGFPVFPGVLLVDTTASVELSGPADFVTQFGGQFVFPYENSLPFWFSGVSHVSVVGGSNVTGWFGFNVYGPGYWTPFDMVFYDSQHNLVAGNTFNVDGGGGLLLFGGGNNTVWGNSFHEVLPAGPNFAIPYSDGFGIQLAESGDLIYNNIVETPTTAWQMILNFYTGAYEIFSDRWNISVQPAWAVHFAPGFPRVSLTGSIVGASWQGGNFWWDYGLSVNPYNGAVNPYGQLPYTENGVTPLGNAPYIYPGGDYAPLT